MHRQRKVPSRIGRYNSRNSCSLSLSSTPITIRSGWKKSSTASLRAKIRDLSSLNFVLHLGIDIQGALQLLPVCAAPCSFDHQFFGVPTRLASTAPRCLSPTGPLRSFSRRGPTQMNITSDSRDRLTGVRRLTFNGHPYNTFHYFNPDSVRISGSCGLAAGDLDASLSVAITSCPAQPDSPQTPIPTLSAPNHCHFIPNPLDT